MKLSSDPAIHPGQQSHAVMWHLMSMQILYWPRFSVELPDMQPAQRLVKSHAVCVLLEGSRFRLASRALGLFFSCCPWNVIDLILLGSADPIHPWHSFCWRHFGLHLSWMCLCLPSLHHWWLHLMFSCNVFALDCRDFMENGLVKMSSKWLRTQTLWTNVN